MTDTVRAVLVGCGGIAGAWLTAISEIPEVEMVGFVDINEEAARARATEFGWAEAAIGSDLTAVLERTRPDVVFDCAVPEAHLPITLEALGRGCHVLGEKPLADSMASARRMIAAAQEAGKLLAVIQNRRYDANIRRLCAFLASGVLGQVTMVASDFFLGAHFGGFRDRLRHVLLLEMAIHTFDAARMISRADPLAVTCHEWNPPGSWYDHHAAAVATFEMTDGIVYSYRGSWVAEGLNTPWESHWRITGTEGSLTWDGGAGFCAQTVVERGGFFSKWRDVEIPSYDLPEGTGGHGGVIREFVRCIHAGGVPETVCTDNVKSLAMVFGAIESAEQGRRVLISDQEVIP